MIGVTAYELPTRCGALCDPSFLSDPVFLNDPQMIRVRLQHDPGRKRLKPNFGQNDKLSFVHRRIRYITPNLLHGGVQLLLIVSCIALRGIHLDDVAWGAPDKTGEVDNDQYHDDNQNDTTAADIHLNNLFSFNSETLTSEKQELIKSRLINIPILK